MAKEGSYAHVGLPSGEVRLVHLSCRATVRQVGNLITKTLPLVKLVDLAG